jgi:choline dehydrogenase-like flavoprotein
MPFTESTFESWPFDFSAMRPHYEAILREIPFAGEDDDLSAAFPLLGRSDPLPSLSLRSQWTLDAYTQNRSLLNGRGITVGKARLAFRSRECVRCGMCMTGCPYRLIYSAADTIDGLLRSNRVTHHSGFRVINVEEDDQRAKVIAVEIATGRAQHFEADRVFIACGAVGSTRLIASSLNLSGVDLPMLESQQYILPFLSARPTPDPRAQPDFTLNQFNMIVALDEESVDISQLHFYTYNSAFIDALPPLLRSRAAQPLQSQLIRRLTVALGYLPSWRSPRLVVRPQSRPASADIADLHISRESAPSGRGQMMRTVLTRLAQAARHLDLYPVIPMLKMAAGGKSYHVGGSFPHSDDATDGFHSDRLGRVANWKRIHAVDASVFPSVPAMTFTLTIMANAHRIASECIGLDE